MGDVEGLISKGDPRRLERLESKEPTHCSFHSEDILEDREGNVWLATSTGVDRFRASRFHTAVSALSFPAFDTAMTVDSAGIKGLLREDFLQTIREVHRGEKRIHPQVAAELAQRCDDASLTAREVEVLDLVAAGKSNKRIAAKLNINEETVKSHIRNILAKLKASDRTHAVTLGLRRGVISLSS